MSIFFWIVSLKPEKWPAHLCTHAWGLDKSSWMNLAVSATPKHPEKKKNTLQKLGSSYGTYSICMTLKRTLWIIMVCPKMVPRKITIREWLFGFPFFFSKGNSTPIGLDENGQESMLDAPWAIPKHKHVYFTMDSAQKNHVFELCYNSWVNGYMDIILGGLLHCQSHLSKL